MFNTLKAKLAARRTENKIRLDRKRQIEQDGYLRRLRNSARCLTGTTHSGHGCDDDLDPCEIQAILRQELYRRTRTEVNS